MFMRRVVHFGPIESKGGMSAVMEILSDDINSKWKKSVISTHSERDFISKIISWHKAKKVLLYLIKNDKIDVAHIHVTHSLSWHRKATIMKICSRNKIPHIIHIHSGKFDIFCSKYFGIMGKLVKKSLNNKFATCAVLEDRWLKDLEYWIPPNSIVINNPSKGNNNKKFDNLNLEKITILLLARDSAIKGHRFAIEIINSLISKNVDARLMMTGILQKEIKNDLNGKIMGLGWISNEKVEHLIKNSDFLLLPSEFEGSSMSIIEAITNDLPCLVSPASFETLGVPELVLTLDSPVEWADKIILLSDNERYMQIISKIRKQSERFSKEEINDKWDKIYDIII